MSRERPQGGPPTNAYIIHRRVAASYGPARERLPRGPLLRSVPKQPQHLQDHYRYQAWGGHRLIKHAKETLSCGLSPAYHNHALALGIAAILPATTTAQKLGERKPKGAPSHPRRDRLRQWENVCTATETRRGSQGETPYSAIWQEAHHTAAVQREGQGRDPRPHRAQQQPIKSHHSVSTNWKNMAAHSPPRAHRAADSQTTITGMATPCPTREIQEVWKMSLR